MPHRQPDFYPGAPEGLFACLNTRVVFMFSVCGMSQRETTGTNEQGSVLTPCYGICLSLKKPPQRSCIQTAAVVHPA